MVNRSQAARAAVEARASVEATWDGACAASDLAEGRVEARELFAEDGGPALRAASEAAWAALVAACEGDEVEAATRFDHYITRYITRL